LNSTLTITVYCILYCGAVITLDNLVPTDNILLVAVSSTNNVWWISRQTSISDYDM